MKRSTTQFVMEENEDRLVNTPFNSSQYDEYLRDAEQGSLVQYITEAAESHRQMMLLDVSDDTFRLRKAANRHISLLLARPS